MLLEMAVDLWQSEGSENHTDYLHHSPKQPGQGHRSSSTCGGRELEHSGWGALSGRGLLLTAKRWPEGT